MLSYKHPIKAVNSYEKGEFSSMIVLSISGRTQIIMIIKVQSLNRIGNPETDSHIHNRGPPIAHQEKEGLFHKWDWINSISIMRKK